MDAFVANDELLPLLRDAGERRRVGTLLVYVDNMERPLLGMPLSLPTVFNGLSEGEVFAVRASHRGRGMGVYLCAADRCGLCAAPHRALRPPLAPNGPSLTSWAGTTARRCGAWAAWVLTAAFPAHTAPSQVGCPQSEHGVSFDAARADYYEVSKLL